MGLVVGVRVGGEGWGLGLVVGDEDGVRVGDEGWVGGWGKGRGLRVRVMNVPNGLRVGGWRTIS